jgi:hypothetical protein
MIGAGATQSTLSDSSREPQPNREQRLVNYFYG